MSAVMKLREFSSYAATPAVDAPPSSSQSQMDASTARLREGAKTFAKLSLEQRITLVNAMQQGFLGGAKRRVQAGGKAKGTRLGKPKEAEEWATGPWLLVPQLRL